MAMVLVQGGSTLYRLSRLGELQALTVPDSVTISDGTPPRFAVFGDRVVMVNSPSRPITVTQKSDVLALTPAAPVGAPTLAAGSGTGLTGAYKMVYTFAIIDSNGNTVAESDFSPESNTFTAANNDLLASGLDVSLDAGVNARKLYRTTAGGAVYFGWTTLDGNTETTIVDGLPDEGLETVAAPTLGTAPDMVLIAEFRGRLFGVPRSNVDVVRYCQPGTVYSWPADNLLSIPGAGWSDRGIVSLLPRKEALGVARSNMLFQITGNDTASFRPVIVHDRLGVESHETVAIWNDTAIYLSKEGVCKWDAEGVRVISDGKVRAWFTSDQYFNRALFARAFGHINPQRKTYQLYLCSAGSPIVDRWIEYDMRTGKWYGPHLTDAFDPTSSILTPDDNDLFIPLVGSFDGHLWKEHAGIYDNVNTPIPFDVITKTHDRELPDLMKYWGDISIFGKAQAAGGTLTITPSLGDSDEELTDGAAISYDMRRGRSRLRRLGTGIMCRLRLTANVVNKPIELYGYEIPGHTLGRR